jgi:hypothetical protein
VFPNVSRGYAESARDDRIHMSSCRSENR